MLCNCNRPSALATIVAGQENIGAITRLMFRRKKTGTTLNAIVVATNDPTELATWTALMALTTSGKVVVTPIVHEPVATAGGAREYTTGVANGIPLLLGENPYTFECKILAEGQEAIDAMTALQCEVNSPEKLTVFLVNECGNIIGQSEDTFTTFRGLDIDYLFVQSDPAGMNRENVQSYSVKIMAKAGWLKNRKTVVPSDFNALEL